MSNFLELTFKQEVHRKYIHLTSSLFGFSILFFEKDILIPIFFMGTILIILVDILRYKSNKINLFIESLFNGVMRPFEREQITGATFLLIGVLITTILFDRVSASTGMFFMSFSDTAAAIIGVRFGKTKIWNDKTLEGSFAFLITSLIIVFMIPEIPLGLGIITAIIVTIVELLAVPKVNDNLLIPIVTATILSLGNIA